MDNIKLCVFDVDGTLIDTREFIASAFEYTLEKFGFQVPSREEIIRIIGKPLETDYQNLTGLSDTAELCKAHRAYQNENQNLIALFPHVEETLKTLKDRGTKIAVATMRSKITSIGSLKQAGIDIYIDLVLSIEDVKNVKPAPDCIINASEHFNILMSEIVMIGDRVMDVETGKNAGSKTIGVLYGNDGEKIKEANPDYTISDMKEILELV